MKTPALESLFNKLTGLQLKKKKTDFGEHDFRKFFRIIFIENNSQFQGRHI